MNNNIRQITLVILWAFSLLICGYLFAPTYQVQAATSVTNSVHVTANGGGQSSASVTTVINGEVVEDWSTTSTTSIEYATTYTTSSTGVEVDAEVETRDQLEAMIAKLQAIISFYVSLLSHQQ